MEKHVLKSACFFRSFLNLAEDCGQHPLDCHACWIHMFVDVFKARRVPWPPKAPRVPWPPPRGPPGIPGLPGRFLGSTWYMKT